LVITHQRETGFAAAARLDMGKLKGYVLLYEFGNRGAAADNS
jgi:hypothetical protein